MAEKKEEAQSNWDQIKEPAANTNITNPMLLPDLPKGLPKAFGLHSGKK